MRLNTLLSLVVVVLLAPVPAAAEQMMRIHTIPADLSSNPINSVAVGEQYRLLVYATDIRDPLPQYSGVFAAGTNVLFDSALSSLDVNQSVVFGSFFNLDQDSVLSPGSAIGWAATFSFSPPGNAPQFLFSVDLTATAPGLQIFTPTFDYSDPYHENLLYLYDGVLVEEQMIFLGSTLQIVPEPSTYVLAAMSVAVLLFVRRRAGRGNG
jgi:hypothetical protein